MNISINIVFKLTLFFFVYLARTEATIEYKGNRKNPYM